MQCNVRSAKRGEDVIKCLNANAMLYCNLNIILIRVILNSKVRNGLSIVLRHSNNNNRISVTFLWVTLYNPVQFCGYLGFI